MYARSSEIANALKNSLAETFPISLKGRTRRNRHEKAINIPGGEPAHVATNLKPCSKRINRTGRHRKINESKQSMRDQGRCSLSKSIPQASPIASAQTAESQPRLGSFINPNVAALCAASCFISSGFFPPFP